jgi:HdeA/HdeB family
MNRVSMAGGMLALAVGVVAIPAIAAKAAADEGEVDIATLTCSKLRTMDDHAVGFAVVWIDGYLGGRADDTVFSSSRMKDNAKEVDRVCKDNPNKSVLSILKDYEAKGAD